jgi:hypothetical protein
MGIRESLNERPKAVAIAVGIAVVAVLAFILIDFGADGMGGQSLGDVPKAWYTDDDGKSWFADAADRTSPFDHNGKPAYRCYVWTVDGGKTKFVSHLERTKPSALKARQASGGKPGPADLMMPFMDLEVKRPLTGDRGWTDYGLPAGEAIRTPHPPAGQQGVPEEVPPS